MNDLEEIRKDIALIKQKVEYIEKEIGGSIKDFKSHVETSQPYRSDLEVVKRELAAHIAADRWLFGLGFTMMTAILTKVMGVW